MNPTATEVVEVPFAVPTVTSTVPATSPGEVAVQLVFEEQLTSKATVIPKSTAVTPGMVENPVPVIVTGVPPETGPELGEIAATVGIEPGSPYTSTGAVRTVISWRHRASIRTAAFTNG